MRRLWPVAAVLLLAGCSAQFPADPHGTLDRVRDGVMRVGVTENPPWVEAGDPSAPTGIEPVLLSQFAASLASEIRWTVGSETVLMEALEEGALDVVVGGFQDDTLWSEKGAITRPYRETVSSGGAANHVMVVRMGENGFLSTLETFLLTEGES